MTFLIHLQKIKQNYSTSEEYGLSGSSTKNKAKLQHVGGIWPFWFTYKKIKQIYNTSEEYGLSGSSTKNKAKLQHVGGMWPF